MKLPGYLRSKHQRWNARWQKHDEYEWQFGRIIDESQTTYSAEENLFDSRPTGLTIDEHTLSGPWITNVRGTPSQTTTPLESIYSAEGYASDESRIHRKFSRLKYDPDKILEFAQEFGLLGISGATMFREGVAYACQGEPYSGWCKEILLIKRLCGWLDAVRTNPPDATTLAQSFEGGEGAMFTIRSEVWRDENEHAVYWTNRHRAWTPAREVRIAPISSLSAHAKTMVFEEVAPETRERLVKLGYADPGKIRLTPGEHDVSTFARYTINHLANKVLAANSRPAIQLHDEGIPDQQFYFVATTLLGVIYRSFIAEMIGEVRAENICLYCEKPFTPSRVNARFCCPSHKATHYNQLHGRTTRAARTPKKALSAVNSAVNPSKQNKKPASKDRF